MTTEYNIESDYVSPELAKLLKELECDIPSSHYYTQDFMGFRADGVLHKNGLPDGCDSKNIFQFVKRSVGQPHLATAPELYKVVNWLLNKYNIYISVHQDYKGIFWCQIHKKMNYSNITKWDVVAGIHNEYTSPQKALDDTIIHTLKTFIDEPK